MNVDDDGLLDTYLISFSESDLSNGTNHEKMIAHTSLWWSSRNCVQNYRAELLS